MLQKGNSPPARASSKPNVRSIFARAGGSLLFSSPAVQGRETFYTVSEDMLYDYIRQKSRERKAFVYALGGLPDHVHLVCSVPVSLAVSEFVKLIKGSSSHYMSHHTQVTALRWQRGYSYLTFSKHDLPAVVQYVECQKERHAENKLWPKL